MADAQTMVAAVEADDSAEDRDSALGDSIASSTNSISSSFMKQVIYSYGHTFLFLIVFHRPRDGSTYSHREENGRTYHFYKDGKYVFPNDEIEIDRLDLQHHLFSLTFNGKLFTAPIGKDKSLHRVLDIGTGTGIWAIDFADEHPESEVLGIDLSPIQPQFIPPNVSFRVDDLEDNWKFTNKFDFIYSRMMLGSFNDWPRLFEQAFANLTPGGYLEIVDVCHPYQSDDGTYPDDSVLQRWTVLLNEALTKTGRDLGSAKQYKSQLEAAGFVNVVETKYVWPLNRWPKDLKLKELGMWEYENLTRGLGAVSMALFTRILGWTQDQVEALLEDVRKDLRNVKMHVYAPLYVVYGQKPE
ncbi:S-adenosyl-L-methionine-dependent methyltransferase-9 [Coleophoma cylindrospora]|uniref:S-adenosyl-L-methionine-dependent methyltransferase-9 n=1 Tax=Coleophoma cylindrospora TaxID=1849047 RepID=A0A3D8QS02_9HELO|nr:S-adenosyl-L-methionine-dependent methyltransferase-9 [Coleophoma cylindrospora]